MRRGRWQNIQHTFTFIHCGNDFNSQQGKYSHVLITLSCVDQLLTNTSVKYPPTIGQVLAKCRGKVGEVSVNEKLYRLRQIWNDYRPCLDRVSTDYRLLYRPTIDRVSTAISVNITYSKHVCIRTVSLNCLTENCPLRLLSFNYFPDEKIHK